MKKTLKIMKEIIRKNQDVETNHPKKSLIDKETITDQRQMENKFNNF